MQPTEHVRHALALDPRVHIQTAHAVDAPTVYRETHGQRLVWGGLDDRITLRNQYRQVHVVIGVEAPVDVLDKTPAAQCRPLLQRRRGRWKNGRLLALLSAYSNAGREEADAQGDQHAGEANALPTVGAVHHTHTVVQTGIQLHVVLGVTVRVHSYATMSGSYQRQSHSQDSSYVV
jgi:hypothetical protein